jgi:hypothetical protein
MSNRFWVAGKRIVTYTDRERPYRSGSIGLYSEDAAAVYSPVKVRGDRGSSLGRAQVRSLWLTQVLVRLHVEPHREERELRAEDQ